MPNFFLYNRQSFTAQRAANMITIAIGGANMKGEDNEPIKLNGIIITAVMQEDFKFGTKANWEQVMKMIPGGVSSSIESLMVITGNKVQNAGGVTKQYYMGSEHIPVSTKFRLFADENPLVAVKALARLCLPTKGATIETYIKGVVETAKTVAGSVGKGVSAGIETAGSTSDTGLRALAEGIITGLNVFFKNLTADVGNEVCYVQFGNWLSGIFVLKSADFTYSRETGTNGQPYYVDFDVSFESLMIPIKDEFSDNKTAMMKLGKAEGSRITFDNVPQ